MKKFAKVIVGVAILLAGVAFSILLWITRPEAEKEERVEKLPTVEVVPVEIRKASFTIPSQGIVEADRRSRLAAEVAGKVTEVAEVFEPGNRVKAGTALLSLDQTDYEAALAQAKANLADAEAALAGEEARAKQAERDVSRLGSGSATDLALRKPQLKSAERRVESAKASVAKAENDLRRTVVRTPFDAIISSKMTEVGSYVSPGLEVAEIFATSPYEVRLPLSVDEVAYLQTGAEGDPAGAIKLQTSAAGITQDWPAEIVRMEGEIDRATRSVYIVAEISDEGHGEGLSPRPGMFVKASIPSREIPGLAKIPFSAFLDLDRVTVIDPDDRVRFREVEVVHREGEVVYVSGGLEKGDRVCLTEIPDLVEGTLVSPRLVKPEGNSDATLTTTQP